MTKSYFFVVTYRNLKPFNTLQNEKLETEELIWDEKEERVHTDKYVKMSTQTEIIYGYGFDSNMDFTKWKVKDVTGTIDASDVMQGIE